MGSTPCCFSTNPAVWCVCEALLEPTSPFLSFLAAFSGPYGHQSGTMSLVPGVVYGTTPPPAAHTAVPVGHLWNASKGWMGGEKVVLSRRCLSSVVGNVRHCNSRRVANPTISCGNCGKRSGLFQQGSSSHSNAGKPACAMQAGIPHYGPSDFHPFRNKPAPGV